METEFIKGQPALFIKSERLLVMGDIHAGRNITLKKEQGLHLPNATERMSKSVLDLYEGTGAKGIVFLGDMKDNISYPEGEEYAEVKRFFESLSGIDITITKGNHDGNIEKLLEVISPNTKVVQELILKKAALLHGHTLPSDETMKKEYVVIAHIHPAIKKGENFEKVWGIAKINNEMLEGHKSYNAKSKLILAPAYNELITGAKITKNIQYAPLLKNHIFDFNNAKVYDLQKKFLGTVAELDSEIISD